MITYVRSVFPLKYRDTLPILEVHLYNPVENAGDTPEAHDLTGADVHLHVLLTDGTVFHREMEIYGDPTGGVARYAWQPEDWDEENEDGFLIVSPDWTVAGASWHRMEYEVVGTGAGERLTFPNGGAAPTRVYDELRIAQDLGQAE